MPVNDVTRRAELNGDNSTLVFPYGFRILNVTGIKVIVDGAIKVNITDYTVSGVGDAGGGNVTFKVAPPTGTKNVIFIGSEILDEQTNYIDGNAFPEVQHENHSDKQAMINQQFREELARCLKFAEQDITKGVIVATPTANGFLKFNAAKDTVNSPTGTPAGGLSSAAPADTTIAEGVAGGGTDGSPDTHTHQNGDHNHNGAAGQGGKTLNDIHEGYLDVRFIAEPASPDASHIRFFANSVGALLQAKTTTGLVFQLEPQGIATTKGDLLVRGDSTQVIREPVGADGTIVTADSTKTSGITYGPGPAFTKEFISADTALTASTATEFTHSLGAVPKLFKITLININAEFGYVTGDEVEFLEVANRAVKVMVLAVDGSTKISAVTTSSSPHVLNKTTGANQNATVANWNYRLRAWA